MTNFSQILWSIAHDKPYKYISYITNKINHTHNYLQKILEKITVPFFKGGETHQQRGKEKEKDQQEYLETMYTKQCYISGGPKSEKRGFPATITHKLLKVLCPFCSQPQIL